MKIKRNKDPGETNLASDLRIFIRMLNPVFIWLSMLAINIQCHETEITGFLKDTKGEYIFSNKKSKLVINKETCKLGLTGEDGILRCIEGAAPAFLVNDQWITLSRAGRLISNNEERAILQASLSDGSDASVEVISLSEFGFKIIVRAGENDISAIRGIIALKPVEEIYGFGEMWNGHVAQRGQSFDIWDKAGTPDECSYMPYFVSTNNYAFFLNYGGRVSFDVGQSNADELVYQAPAKFFDITLVSGNSIATSVQNFLAITGMPAKPPFAS